MTKEAAEALQAATAKRFNGETIQSIDLDCPPGAMRPGHLIGYVIEGLGLTCLNPDATPFFGAAEYLFEVDKAEWIEKYQPTIKERVTKLYNDGIIRYGSW